MALDNTCFGYNLKTVGIKTIELCIPLHCGECENCKFYKPLHVLQHDKAVATIRLDKIELGKLKIKYNLRVNGNNEGNFESIKEIDDFLKTSKYSFADNIKLTIEEIYEKNAISIKML